MRVQNNIPFYFILIAGLVLTAVASVIRISALNITGLLTAELKAPGSAAIGGMARSLSLSHTRA